MGMYLKLQRTKVKLDMEQIQFVRKKFLALLCSLISFVCS